MMRDNLVVIGGLIVIFACGWIFGSFNRPPIKWTTAAPSEPGLYWIRSNEAPGPQAVTVAPDGRCWLLVTVASYNSAAEFAEQKYEWWPEKVEVPK